MGLTTDEQALLRSQNFSFRPLARAGHLDLREIIKMTVRPSMIFIFSVVALINWFRYENDAACIFICMLGDVLMMAFPTVAMLVLITGVVSTALKSKVRLNAVVYWSYWPCWQFIMCYAAASLGAGLGHYLWEHQFQPYTTVSRLQTYGMIDPSKSSGQGFQDAGIIDFVNGVGLDRAKGGCFVNAHTYCVAPIAKGGKLNATADKAAAVLPSHDFFAVGIDCCSCPNSDFRCGSWNDPRAQGGLRATDPTWRPFLKYAVDDWAAAWGAESRHPIFFEWTTTPRKAFAELWTQGMVIAVLACVAVVPVCLFVAMLLNRFLNVLAGADLAVPIETFAPPSFMQDLSSHALPEMMEHRAEQEEQRQRVPPGPGKLAQAHLANVREAAAVASQAQRLCFDRTAPAGTGWLLGPGPQGGGYGTGTP